jgi:glycosyltransferase involved in cell wall biosynthesis
MAVGRPIVVGNIGDSGKFVRTNGVGVAYDGGPKGFVDTICSLVSNPVIAEEMGRRGRHLIESEYSWEVITAGIERLYYDIKNEKR